MRAGESNLSQYGLGARVVRDEERGEAHITCGLAKHLRDALPNASFIGFTGTPIEAADRSTPAVFGNHIDVYAISRAVEDGATVRIYYEARLAKLDLNEAERPRIDPAFEEVTEGEELEPKEELKSRWARLEVVVGAEKRLALVAADLVAQIERRLEALDGTVMIVCSAPHRGRAHRAPPSSSAMIPRSSSTAARDDTDGDLNRHSMLAVGSLWDLHSPWHRPASSTLSWSMARAASPSPVAIAGTTVVNTAGRLTAVE